MRVFVTGGSGFVGSAVVAELVGAGHAVLGLARSDASAHALEAAGAETVRGDLADPEGLARSAAACDGVVHCAFNHDFSRYLDNIAEDRRALEAMAQALEGSGKPLLGTFGVIGVTHGRPATEGDAPTPNPMLPRADTEQVLLDAAKRGVRGVVVRLPPSVHGRGDHGFVPMLVATAREKGYAAYVGDGANRWPATHRKDAARVYRLGLERAAAGARLHAMAEEGVPFRAIAEAIGAGLGLPVRSIPGEEAMAYFGFLGLFAGGDAAASSTTTRTALDWTPQEPGLIADMHEGGYFD